MALNVKVTLQEPPHRTITGLEDADAIRIISGWVKWCLDFQSWLIDALDDDDIFAEAKAGQQLDMAALSARIIESKNVALHVLLASSTRGLLIAICRRLIHLDYTARKAINAVNMQNGHGAPFISNTLRQSYTAIAALTNASVIRCQKFEKLLESISAAVKNAYQAANLPSGPPPLHTPPKVGEATRNAIEQQILFGEHLPRIFAPVVAEMFSTMLPKLKADIDPSELFFHDYSLLGLPDANAPETLAQLEGLPAPRKQQLRKQLEERAFKVIDVLTKTPKDMRSQDHNGKSGRAERRFKRCARCAAAMEDTIVTRPSAANYLISQQRRCYCNGNWNILPAGKAVA
jgi:mediator of RNA polymerase II transcription subunit 16